MQEYPVVTLFMYLALQTWTNHSGLKHLELGCFASGTLGLLLNHNLLLIVVSIAGDLLGHVFVYLTRRRYILKLSGQLLLN